MQYNMQHIRQTIQKHLSPSRYKHTLGVEETACSLACQHHIDVEKARVAALLHDCAKNISNDKKLELCKEYDIELTNEETKNPDLVHAKVGAVIAKHLYNINDSDIINAIAFHTTGRPGMSDLEKLIYIADYIEPGRNKAPHLKKIRELAIQDLDAALVGILQDTVAYLQSTNKIIDPLTLEAYHYYKPISKNKKQHK